MSDPDDLSSLTMGWPGRRTLAAASDTEILGVAGDLDARFEIASITKLFTCYAALIAIEEGTISLDDRVGPETSTVRHLMSHAAGLAFDSPDQLAPVGTRRIYSNIGIELLAAHLEAQAGIAFADYLYEGVLVPVGLGHVEPHCSPAHGLHLSTRSLIAFARELLDPTLVAPNTLAMATTVHFPDLNGVLPGFGLQSPNPWGLGFETRGAKYPHWTGANQASSTFGHFGGSGSFLWIDPLHGLIGASLGSERFGDWAVSAWPSTNAELFRRYS